MSKRSRDAEVQIKALQSKLAAIDRSQAVIEFDLSGRILWANDNFLNAMGYRADEVIGRPHSLFVTPEYAASPEYASLWRRLNAGEFVAGKFPRIGAGGRMVWIEAAYNPVLDKDGKPFMVIKYATDVTASVMRAAQHAGQIDAISRSQAMITFSLDGVITSANSNFLNAMGYSEAEIIGRHHSLFVESSTAQSQEYKAFWEKLRNGEFIAAEFKRVGNSGREVWIQASYNPILDPMGKPVSIVKFATDITKAKMKSADDAGQLDAINKSQAVISFDMDGMILSANENFLKVVGYELDEVIGRHHSMFVDKSYMKSADYAKFWAHLRSGKHHSGEFQRVGKTGATVWLQASYNPIFDLNGALSKIVKYATDITEEVNRRASFNLLSMVANETDNSVVITDRFQKIIYVNRGFERLTGYTLKEVIGRKPGHILQGKLTDKNTISNIRSRLATGNPFYDEILNYDRHKKPYWISLAINPVRGADGQIDRFISIQANITETKQTSLEFNVKLDAIGASSAMAEWSVQGVPLLGNDIITRGRPFDLALSKALDSQDIALILQEGMLRREIAIALPGGQHTLWIDGIFTVLRDLEGAPQRILMCGADITARRVAIQASVDGMSSMMQRITLIVESISSFARQTNLLALNAAVEAARAQDYGRGFSLIAQEIRKLSQEAAGSISQINGLLLEGQAQVKAMSSEVEAQPTAQPAAVRIRNAA